MKFAVALFAVMVVAATVLWVYRRRDARIAQDPSTWPRTLPVTTLVRYTNLFLRSAGWNILPPKPAVRVLVRARKGRSELNLFVPDDDGVGLRTLLFDCIDRTRNKGFEIGILTARFISDDERQDAARNAILLLNPVDLPNAEQALAVVAARRKEIAMSGVGPESPGGPAGTEAPGPNPEGRAGEVPVRVQAEEACAAAVRALRASGRHDEADEMCAQAAVLFPDAPWPLADLARAALTRKDWAAAVERAAALRSKFPADRAGYSVALQALRRLNRYDESEAILSQADAALPGEEWILVDGAWLAQQRADWDEGLRRAGAVRSRFPAQPAGYRVGAFCLQQLKRYTEAEGLLEAAIEALGGPVWARADFARLARLQKNWPEAARRWAEFRAAFPDLPEGFIEGAIASRGIGDLATAERLQQQAQRMVPAGATEPGPKS